MDGTSRPRDLFDDLGAAIAAAIAPHRFLGLLLVLVAPLTALDGGPSAPTWAACSGFVAGALLASRRLVFVATLPAIGWLVCMAVPPAPSGLRSGEMWMLTTICGAAGAVAGVAKRSSWAPYGGLAVAAALAAALRASGVQNALAAYAVVALATICAALVVSSGRLLVPAGAVLGTCLLCLPNLAATWRSLGFAGAAWIATNAVLLAWIAGRTHAALREGRTDGQEAAARLVVRAQLSTWTSCVALGALFVYVAWVMAPGHHDEAAIGRIAGLALAAAFLDHLARGARARLDRLAGVAVALAMAWPVAEIVFGGGAQALGKATCLLVLPQALGRALDSARRPEEGAGLPIAAVGAAVMPPHDGPIFVAWLFVVACAFHLTALSDVPARRIFWCTAALGALSGIFRTLVHDTRHPVTQAAEVAGLWLVGATLALAARRTRTMTAVPDDHAVRADFGVRAERAAA